MSCQPRPPSYVRGHCYPPERRFADLDSIARHYIGKHRDNAEKELAAFRNQPSFRDCIRQAGLARRWDGNRWKRLDHQRRIPKAALATWMDALLRQANLMWSCQSFEALFHIVAKESRKLWGIGDLTVYDTALRIAAYRNLEPKDVFLHSGTREGAKALGFDGTRRSIRPGELPKGLRRLKPYEIEDFLCLYKDHLKEMQSF